MRPLPATLGAFLSAPTACRLRVGSPPVLVQNPIALTLHLDDSDNPIIRDPLQPEDNERLGTLALVVNIDKDGVLLYVGDNQEAGKNNVRRSISTNGAKVRVKV